MSCARITKGSVTIPTYRLLEPNLNPMLDRRLNPYPYTLLDKKSYVLEDVEYEAVFLENEYLKLTVLPELGGRLYSAYDKRTGEEVFYKNPVVKPRMIATRGAWISGGVEFNFPISHSPTTMDRVNYLIENYDDGSVSVVFGDIEQMSYMNWKVELRLYPGRAYIEQNVWLYNPTMNENRYYFWTNAAVKITDDMRLIYPFDWSINNKCPEYIKWPVYNGMNCTDPRQFDDSYETFGKLLKENFFGIYDSSLDRGVVHYADRKKVKGAKFFIWGNDGRSVMWNRALNGEGDKYIEIQSGPFESQGVFKFMKPHQQLKWSEYWYPVFGTKGFRFSEKELAVNYVPVEKGVEFRLFATENLGECRVKFEADGRIQEATINLNPDNVGSVVFELEKPFHINTEFEFDVYCARGHVINIGRRSRNEYCSEPLDVDLYEDSRVIGNGKEKDGLFKAAMLNESFGAFEKALELYNKNLETCPDCHETMYRLAQIYLRTGMPQKTKELCHRILRYNNRNSEARFLYAAAEKELGSLDSARRLFMDIAADNYNFEASVIELVKLDILMGYYKEAREFLENNITVRTGYTDFLASICYRKEGLGEKARKILENSCARDEFILAELFCLGDSKDRQAFVDYTRGGASVVKTLALEYAALGLYEDAEKLLATAKEKDVKIKLLSLYLSEKTGNPGFMLEDITSVNIDYAFVNEKILVDVLEQKKDLDGTGVLDYILGTWYYSVARKQEALELFHRAYDKGLRYTVLLRNLGYAYYSYKKDYDAAARYFEEDLAVNGGGNADSFTYLDMIYREKGDLESRKKLIPYMNQATNRSLVLPFLCGIYKDLGEEDKALEILSREEFEVWENKELSGRVYWDVMLSLVKKALDRGDVDEAGRYIDKIRSYPDNINFGESIREPYADVFYYIGIVRSLQGDEKAAVEAFEQGIRQLECKHPNVVKNRINRYYIYKCMEELQKRFS